MTRIVDLNEARAKRDREAVPPLDSEDVRRMLCTAREATEVLLLAISMVDHRDQDKMIELADLTNAITSLLLRAVEVSEKLP